ncbi:MAG: ribbon-helix-helix protein, CopG family [Steroidobacteraceae bacterium]|nr:ribbon-helix-helix protein, CopG family [Steroidobacteraceae bacterium]
MKNFGVVKLEERTARLTILIDPRKKAVFEQLCAQEDLTSSQVIRRMIRAYIEARLGRPWVPGEEALVTEQRAAGARSAGVSKRRTSRS